MSPRPLVSVITPTWQRHDLLFSRCIPSVREQQYPEVEHIVVSDGPDPELRMRLAPGGPDGHRRCWFRELPAHDPAPHWGHLARLAGLEYASGDIITYCDDDDALRPRHCALMAGALEAAPGAGFAVSRMASHNGDAVTVIGYGGLACGNLGTPMIAHRRCLLEYGTWDHAGAFEDWDLVASWLDADVPYVNVDAETSDVWPSIFRPGG